jgi:L-fuconolactonase
MRIIDTHQHFWKRDLFSGRFPPKLLNDFRPEDLKPLLDQTNVRQTVLVQTHSSLDNSYDFLKIADSNDWIAGVMGWVDLCDPRVGETLDDLVEHPKFKGVRHQWEDEPDPAWINRPDVLRGLCEVAKRGLVYDLLAKPPNWPYLHQVADAVPELPMVIDHIAKPRIRTGQFDDWARVMERSAEIPTMMCKLSGMTTEADWQHWTPADLKPYVMHVVNAFGVERVMWGSDWPVCLLASTYAQTLDSLRECLKEMSESEKARILGENARNFYKIGS